MRGVLLKDNGLRTNKQIHTTKQYERIETPMQGLEPWTTSLKG